MARTILYVILGYLSGSILYANVFCAVFGKANYLQNSADGNPGTSNAFKYGGFACGMLTLVCDIAKGFVPVLLYGMGQVASWGLSLVLAAPVLGHVFPAANKFHGGKGIATSFGCLLGLHPYYLPFLILAVVFIVLSVAIKITPNLYRTYAAYPCATAAMLLFHVRPEIWIGFALISGIVCARLYFSNEVKQSPEVQFLWKH